MTLDVRTGEVLALASVPTFEPGAFANGLSQETWRAWLTDPNAPLVNKAIAGQYPPGSTFKMIVALAALEAGIVAPDHEVSCLGLRAARPAPISLLAALGPRQAQAGRGHRAVLRRLFLRARPQARHRRHRRDGPPLRPGRPAGHRSARRAGRSGAGPGLEARHPGRAVAEGRDPGGRDRSGLSAGDPVAAGGHGRAHRQWRARDPALAGPRAGRPRPDRGAAARGLRMVPRPRQGRHVSRGQRRARHRPRGPAAPARGRHGRQDRNLPGPPDQPRRAGDRGAQERGEALGGARSCAVRGLRSLPRAPLCRGGRGRARRQRQPGRGADRSGHPGQGAWSSIHRAPARRSAAIRDRPRRSRRLDRA